MKNQGHFYTLMLTNTLTNTKEPFIVPNPEHVTMYVCGITPYDYAHIGHGRCYVTFDVLYRLLLLLGHTVTYCRNFTDVDDKLINRAAKELGNPEAYLTLADKFIEAFHQDMKVLNCLPPTYEPRVTTHIPQIQNFVQSLVYAGNAYVADGDVYFSIKSFPDYGKLSKRNISELEPGARVEVRQDKVDPLDFALWKKEQEAPGWESHWGFGRPGWHIECSTLADIYLGKTIDIHGGGMDLIFPHHENEIAQSESLHHKPLARYWVHNAFVRINHEKMSKSLGNFITLRDICTHFNPMVVRYYYLLHHYRSPLDFSQEDIEAATKSYQRLCKFFEQYDSLRQVELCFEEAPIVAELIKALCDDLNIAKFFGIIFDNLKNLEEDSVQAGLVKALIQQALGLTLEPLPEKEVSITPQIQKLLDERQAARKAKDWAKADALRDELKELGIDVHDTKL
jgi:cysteinyl-tRNA synthetase